MTGTAATAINEAIPNPRPIVGTWTLAQFIQTRLDLRPVLFPQGYGRLLELRPVALFTLREVLFGFEAHLDFAFQLRIGAALQRFAEQYVRHFAEANAFGVLPYRAYREAPRQTDRVWQDVRYRYFMETDYSGPALKNVPGTGGLGNIQSHSLEVSNTDVAKEFINMIAAQRAYQANAAILKRYQKMVETTLELLR